MTFFAQNFFRNQAIKHKLTSLSKVPRLFVALFIVLLSLHISACAENDKKAPYLTKQSRILNLYINFKKTIN